DYDTAWNAGLSYGKADWKKAGTWDLSVAYNDVDQYVYFGGGTWHNDMLKNLTGAETVKNSNVYYQKATNLTFWNVLANVTLQKNVQLHAEYAFGADAEGTNGVDPDDSWTVSLNYKF
ncbi:MAG: S-layer protein, partial [Dialister sp.]|nr:S-layer protein [Dialister sp.]